jgi:hypothetical protein
MLKNVAIPMMLSVVEGQTMEQFVKAGIAGDKATPAPVFIGQSVDQCGKTDEAVEGLLATESTKQAELVTAQEAVAALIAGAWGEKA